MTNYFKITEMSKEKLPEMLSRISERQLENDAREEFLVLNSSLNRQLILLWVRAMKTRQNFLQVCILNQSVSVGDKCFYMPRVQLSGAALSIVWYKRRKAWGKNSATGDGFFYESIKRNLTYRYSRTKFPKVPDWAIEAIEEAEDTFEQIRIEAAQLQEVRRTFKTLTTRHTNGQKKLDEEFGVRDELKKTFSIMAPSLND